MRLPLLSLAALGGLGALLLRQTHDQIVANPDPAAPEVIGPDPPGRTRWIDRPDGTRIRVVEAGEGPTVVLAHGFGLSILAWSLVQPALVEAGYHVVAFDWRGHCRTTIGADGVQPEVIAEDYVAVFEEMDLTDAVLVGHSTGGYLAIAALLDTCGAMASWAESGIGPYRASTVSLQSEAFAPAPAEDLVAYGRCTHRDGDIFWADVDITAASTATVVGRGTVLYRIVTN